ncbi:MAG: NfeD family protein [Prevotella sp.]|nr:NfeD family protein [Prevotella sp.]
MAEYLVYNQWATWLIVAALCLIIELASFDFYISCFALGAFAALLVSLTGLPFWAQVVVWAVFSVLSICFVRPALTHFLHRKAHKRESNADALIGRRGVVTEPIRAGGYGYVKIDGDEWRSVTADGTAVETGARVEVLSRESIILTVRVV